jgi:hypothetical protein
MHINMNVPAIRSGKLTAADMAPHSGLDYQGRYVERVSGSQNFDDGTQPRIGMGAALPFLVVGCIVFWALLAAVL